MPGFWVTTCGHVGIRGSAAAGARPPWMACAATHAIVLSGSKLLPRLCLGPWPYHSRGLCWGLWLLLMLKAIKLLGDWGHVGVRGPWLLLAHAKLRGMCWYPGPWWHSGPRWQLMLLLLAMSGCVVLPQLGSVSMHLCPTFHGCGTNYPNSGPHVWTVSALSHSDLFFCFKRVWCYHCIGRAELFI